MDAEYMQDVLLNILSLFVYHRKPQILNFTTFNDLQEEV